MHAALNGDAPVKSQEQLLDHEESLYGEQAAHLQGQDGQKALDMSGRKGSKTASRSAFATLFQHAGAHAGLVASRTCVLSWYMVEVSVRHDAMQAGLHK